jgi:copper chaperone CopZ
MNAIGCCGVQLYRFGEAISVPFFTHTWRPASFFDKLEANLSLGLHSLVLVDIKTREPTLPSLARGRPVYLPPRFMTVRQAAAQILEIATARASATAIGPSSPAIGVARVGTETQLCVHGSLSQLLTVDFGPPLHSMVLLGRMTDVETGLVGTFCVEAGAAEHFSVEELERIDAAAERAARAHETGYIEEEEEEFSSCDEAGGEVKLVGAKTVEAIAGLGEGGLATLEEGGADTLQEGSAPAVAQGGGKAPMGESAKGHTDADAKASKEEGAPAPASETAFQVADMACQADAERVKSAIMALAGVRSVSIDLQARLVKVAGSPGFPAAGVVIQAVAAAGCAATERRMAGGVFKFDPSEGDVEGGKATADDFLDAFGF